MRWRFKAISIAKHTSLIVPLDVDTLDAAREAVDGCGPVPVYKVGFQLFTRSGREAVAMVRDAGKDVFLDLKLYDIPNTVEKGAAAAADMGVLMTTVHASGGPDMITAARRAVEGSNTNILAVTVLTSFDEASWKAVANSDEPAADAVVRLAVLAYDAGAHGIVASPREAAAIREALGPEALIVTPGVRPAWASTDDQARVMTPRDAAQAGVDYIVCGRPILKHVDPAEAARLIMEEMTG